MQVNKHNPAVLIAAIVTFIIDTIFFVFAINSWVHANDITSSGGYNWTMRGGSFAPFMYVLFFLSLTIPFQLFVGYLVGISKRSFWILGAIDLFVIALTCIMPILLVVLLVGVLSIGG